MAKKGILLVNIGSPKSTEVSDVREYLKEFLMDQYVLDVPWLLRALIVYCFVLPFRPKKSAEAYASIWTEKGSPLVVITEELAAKLQKTMPDTVVKVGMRYQEPSILNAFRAFEAEGITEVVAIPQFPHNAYSTTVGLEAYLYNEVKQFPSLNLRVTQAFYKNPDYISALLASAKPHLPESADYLLFSYHGIPERQIRRCDVSKAHCLKENCCETPSLVHEVCYKAQTVATTKLFIEKSGWTNPWSISYQSRLGRDPWLTPFTDATVIDLAKKGVKNLVVMCPAFTADCLETLEEIGEEAKELFEEHGGEHFTLIPCMNTHDDYVHFLKTLI